MAAISEADKGGGVYALGPRSKTWKSRSVGIEEAKIVALIVDHKEANRIYAGGQAGVYVTTNFGQSWQLLKDGIDPLESVNSLAVSSDGSRLFAGENSCPYGLLLRRGGIVVHNVGRPRLSVHCCPERFFALRLFSR